MNLISKIATAGAVAAMGVGLGAAGASATITLSPPNTPFVGTGTTVHSFQAGDFTVTCTGAGSTFTGNTANSSTNVIPFTAAYTNCDVDITGDILPVEITVRSDWALTYQSKLGGVVTSRVDLTTPAGGGAAVIIDITDLGCSISVAPQSNLSSVTATNVASPTGVNVNANVAASYTTNCPLINPSGSATYTGSVNIPGITMTGV